MTTVAFGQDWDVDSRTRINMSGDNNRMETSQRATIGATWGGDDWGIHVSTDVNYELGVNTNGAEVPVNLYEAYASTNVMGYANVTVGRQALNYGSGMILSSNDWANNRTVWDGFSIDLGVDLADITIGYASRTNDATGELDANGEMDNEMSGNTMYANVGKADGDWSVNLLILNSGTELNGEETSSLSAMGLDLTYALMGGDLGLGLSYNTATTEEGANSTDMDMMDISATYQINDDFSVTAGQATYGEEGFVLDGTDFSGGLENSGQLGYLTDVNYMGGSTANMENMHVGVDYAMGDFSMGLTMNMIGNSEDDDYERTVNAFNLGYSMSDNANLGLSWASDKVGDADAINYMWVTLNVTP